MRELENVIERTVALESSEIISSGSLPEHLRGSPEEETPEHISLPEEGIDLEGTLKAIESRFIRAAIERAAGVKTHAAALLGLSFRSLRYRLQKLDLEAGETEAGDDED